MLDFSPTVYSDPKYSSTWSRSLPVDGFYTFSIQVDDSKMFLTADGKHNLTFKGRILLFIHLSDTLRCQINEQGQIKEYVGGYFK